MKVLITTDGSEEATDSIRRYCQMRPRVASTHTVLTVDEFQAYGIIDTVDQVELDRLHHENCQRILNLTREVLAPIGVQADYIARLGQSADTILTTAEELDTDLIVIGARGNGAITRLLLGSTSDAVVSHSKCSVWVVRPKTVHADVAAPHITVGYDGSETAKRTVEFVRSLALPASSQITFVSIVRRPENLPDEIVYDEKQQEQLRHELKDLLSHFPSDGPKVDFVVDESRHVGHGLVEFAAKQRSSLIVVGDKGRSAIARFFIGSISRFVLHHAPCSVLVVKK